MAIRLNVTRRNTVDLLLKNNTGKQGHHDGSGSTPPRLRHDVQETGIVQFHTGFETADFRHVGGGATGLPC